MPSDGTTQADLPGGNLPSVPPGDSGDSPKPSTDITGDISDLPDAAQTRVKAFQADYSRKTQQLAKDRQEVEGLRTSNAELQARLQEHLVTLANAQSAREADGEGDGGKVPAGATSQGTESFAVDETQLPPEFADYDEAAATGIVKFVNRALKAALEAQQGGFEKREKELLGKLRPFLQSTLSNEVGQEIERFLAQPNNAHFKPHRDAVVQWYVENNVSPKQYPPDEQFKKLDYDRLSGALNEAVRTGRLDLLQELQKSASQSVPAAGAAPLAALDPSKSLEEIWVDSKALANQPIP